MYVLACVVSSPTALYLDRAATGQFARGLGSEMHSVSRVSEAIATLRPKRFDSR